MEIRFIKSARKHRIGKAHALFVIENNEPIADVGRDEFERKLFWQGLDDRYVGLEIVGIEIDEVIIIIHVMPTSYRKKGFDEG